MKTKKTPTWADVNEIIAELYERIDRLATGLKRDKLRRVRVKATKIQAHTRAAHWRIITSR